MSQAFYDLRVREGKEHLEERIGKIKAARKTRFDDEKKVNFPYGKKGSGVNSSFAVEEIQAYAAECSKQQKHMLSHHLHESRA